MDFRELVYEHELTHGQSLSDSLDSVLIGPPHNVSSDHEDGNSQYIVLIVYDMAAAIDISKRMKRPGAHSDPFCSALRLY